MDRQQFGAVQLHLYDVSDVSEDADSVHEITKKIHE